MHVHSHTLYAGARTAPIPSKSRAFDMHRRAAGASLKGGLYCRLLS